MTESQQTREFLACWRRAHPWGLAIKYNDRSTKGIWDAELADRGRMVKVEFKREGERLTPTQDVMGRRYREAGITTVVIRFHPRREVTMQVDNHPPRRATWAVVIANWADWTS